MIPFTQMSISKELTLLLVVVGVLHAVERAIGRSRMYIEMGLGHCVSAQNVTEGLGLDM